MQNQLHPAHLDTIQSQPKQPAPQFTHHHRYLSQSIDTLPKQQAFRDGQVRLAGIQDAQTINMPGQSAAKLSHSIDRKKRSTATEGHATEVPPYQKKPTIDVSFKGKGPYQQQQQNAIAQQYNKARQGSSGQGA